MSLAPFQSSIPSMVPAGGWSMFLYVAVPGGRENGAPSTSTTRVALGGTLGTPLGEEDPPPPQPESHEQVRAKASKPTGRSLMTTSQGTVSSDRRKRRMLLEIPAHCNPFPRCRPSPCRLLSPAL